MKKVRLDQLVYEQGHTESRERAKTTIMAGLVFVNGQRADKPGMAVSPDVQLEVRGSALPFVSRGGYKLDKALKVFSVDPTARPPVDLPMCCCSTAPKRSIPWTWDTASWPGSSARMSVW